MPTSSNPYILSDAGLSIKDSKCTQQAMCSTSHPDSCTGIRDCLKVEHTNSNNNRAGPSGLAYYSSCQQKPPQYGGAYLPKGWTTCTTLCDTVCAKGLVGKSHPTFRATGDMGSIANASTCSSYGDMAPSQAMFTFPFDKRNQESWIHCNGVKDKGGCEDEQWPVNCAYDASKIWEDKTGKTLKAVKDNITDFGFDEGDKGYKQFTDRYPDEMQNLCMTKQSKVKCNPGWSTGSAMPACAGVHATGDLGAVCNSWWASLDPKTQRDPLMTTYCGEPGQTDNPECQCVSPSPTLYPDYQYLVNNNINAGNKGCWWKACISGTGTTFKAFIPSDVTPSPCPDVCKAIVNVADGSKISNSTFSQHVNCNFGNGKKNGGGSSNGGDGDGSGVDKKQKQQLIIIAAAAVVILLLLTAAAY